MVLPDDIGMYEDVIARWESITVNLVNSQRFQDKQAIVKGSGTSKGGLHRKLGETELE